MKATHMYIYELYGHVSLTPVHVNNI